MKGESGKMFEIGEYIVYGVKGVCRIEDITHIDISGADKDRLYYVLAPVGDGSGRIYAPTDNQKITMRKVISREEADQLIEDMPKIEQLWVPENELYSELSLTLGIPKDEMEQYIRERLTQ